jgi:glycerophosphoryl diester phosphodiesterase
MKSHYSLSARFPFVILALRLWSVISDGDLPCIPTSLSIPSTVTTHSPKIIIAHRGASAHLPEHTLPAYRLALELGADYFEPDLVATKDNQLVSIHSMDLNITTNVAELFPDRATFSKYLNRNGYWTYNFDLVELQTLTVRQRLPTARSTQFDGMFGIPTLTEILQLVKDWNENVEPLLFDTTSAVRAIPGIYAELKDYPWLQEDANVDLLDLLFQHMDDNKELWSSAIFERLCPTQQLKIHEYRLPPFVVQSFEGKVLQSFTERWKATFIGNETSVDATGTSTTITTSMPVPATILLVSRENCLEESFWFQVGDSWRQFLSGVGPDKTCLHDRWREFMEQATKFNLVVHPWTQRPELEFVRDPGWSTNFSSVLEETRHLFCTVNVQGIFSESVQVAVVAAYMGCEDDDEGIEPSPVEPPSSGTDAGDETPPSGDYTDSLCYETDREAQMYVGLAAFTMGVFLSALGSLWIGRSHRRRGRRQMRIPTIETADELELT